MTQRLLNALPSDPAEMAFEPLAQLDRAAPLPPGRYVAPMVPPVTDQGSEGTCVAHAAGNVYGHWYRRRYGRYPALDQRAFYTLVRRAVGAPPDPTFTQGLSLLWALRTMKGSGYPLADGSRGPRISGYALVGTVFDDLQRALWQTKSLVLARTDWDANWMWVSPSTRIVKPPVGQIIGGHAVTFIGFDDAVNGEAGILRNSWGLGWAGNGTAYMADRYVDTHRLEGWIVTGIE